MAKATKAKKATPGKKSGTNTSKTKQIAAGRKIAAGKPATGASKTTNASKTKSNTAGASKGSTQLTAKQFMEKLQSKQSAAELKKIQRYFKSGEGQYGEGDQFIGVRMGDVFALAKEFGEMPIAEIEKLLESPIHEARAGGVSIMDKAARNKKTPGDRRKEFFDLYMKRHDRINNWDLVDLGCLHMTGSYLYDKPHDILYKLARSKNMWERRSAIISTTYFIRQGDVTDTFKIAEILVNDKEDLVHKATGWMLRFAGTKDRQKLLTFLDKYAATMPRTLLRYSIEHFDKKQKEKYMNMKKAG
jgi:3-methyladenine DNA glycosylase AlkD